MMEQVLDNSHCGLGGTTLAASLHPELRGIQSGMDVIKGGMDYEQKNGKGGKD